MIHHLKKTLHSTDDVHITGLHQHSATVYKKKLKLVCNGFQNSKHCTSLHCTHCNATPLLHYISLHCTAYPLLHCICTIGSSDWSGCKSHSLMILSLHGWPLLNNNNDESIIYKHKLAYLRSLISRTHKFQPSPRHPGIRFLEQTNHLHINGTSTSNPAYMSRYDCMWVGG